MIDDYLVAGAASIALELGTNDRYGQPALAAPAPVTCRVQHKACKITTATGDEVVSESQIFVPPATPATTRCKVEFEGRTWSIVAVQTLRDLDHVPVYKILFLGGDSERRS